MFQPVDSNVNFPSQELAIGRFWKEARIYEKSLQQRAGAPPFVFYEGPPTANGMPHPGHCLTRAIKDLFPRYKTMRGFRCERKAGWDTHGLPVEVEVCKELGIHSKEEIEAYGVEKFIQKCQQSVWRYMREWERLTERIGFWVDLEKAYVTYHQSYVESVWWSLKNLFDRGLLYQGHKIVWWWAQGGTALSAGEVGLGYREVADPSVYVRFPLIDPSIALCDALSDPSSRAKLNEFLNQFTGDNVPASLQAGEWPWTLELRYRVTFKKLNASEALYTERLRRISLAVWTTTPWTLLSNQFVAVNPKLTYVIAARREGDQYELLIVADERFEELEDEFESELVEICEVMGSDLIGSRYLPPFDTYYPLKKDSASELLYPGTLNEHLGTLSAEDAKQTLIYQYGYPFGLHLTARDEFPAWRIVEGQFVTTDSGTGLVHIAPAFGEDDYALLGLQQTRYVRNPPALICAVQPNGKFNSDIADFGGKWVKDCDKDIVRRLKSLGLLIRNSQYLHEYPFCWRAEQDPLIQYPRLSWFIRTTEYKDAMLANNAKINWLPDHIQTGRFGKFLESNVDWALSRERYWSTPLPIWKCEKTGEMEAIGSYAELLAKPGVTGTEVWDAAKKKNSDLPEDLRVHKPYIDAVTYDSRFAKGGRMRRVPDVIDAWYDSGAMPFAQWGYKGEPPLPSPPHQEEGADGPQRFFDQFPADFISEAIDQTRGWFYGLLAISTMLFSREARGERREPAAPGSAGGSPTDAPFTPYPHPFRNCIVLGLMLSEWWESRDGKKLFLTEEDAVKELGAGNFTHHVGKMSKQKRNYREPNEIFDNYGADALRWYFFANQPPWTAIRYSEQAIKDSIPEFLLRLWNVYSFFVIYANIDGFDPSDELRTSTTDWSLKRPVQTLEHLESTAFAHSKSYRPIGERNELDRWILSELNRTCRAVVERMDAYDNFGAAQHIIAFVDALSNWYVRRSRDRFWAADKRAAEKLDAYWTLYESLVTTTKLVAPFVPFLAETMWQNLARCQVSGVRRSESSIGCQNSSPIPDTGHHPKDSHPTPVESVHLCDYPTGDAPVIDEALSARMNLVREIASLGRAARNVANLKVRQPLAKVEVVLADTVHQPWLEEHAELIAEELNVKAVEFTTHGEQYISYSVVPNFKRLGPRLGKNMPAAKKTLAEVDAGWLLLRLRDAATITLSLPDGTNFELERDDIEVRLAAKEGWAAAQGKGCVLVLATELTPELLAEGLARDIVRIIQDQRKELGCEYTDRIEIGLVTRSNELVAAIQKFRDYIAQETLAINITTDPLAGVQPVSMKVLGHDLAVYLRVAK